MGPGVLRTRRSGPVTARRGGGDAGEAGFGLSAEAQPKRASKSGVERVAGVWRRFFHPGASRVLASGPLNRRVGAPGRHLEQPAHHMPPLLSRGDEVVAGLVDDRDRGFEHREVVVLANAGHVPVIAEQGDEFQELRVVERSAVVAVEAVGGG